MKERTTKGCLEGHLMGLLALLERELGGHVFLQQATLPIAATILPSTSFWIALRDSSMVDSFSFWSKTSSVFFFFVCSFLKKSSLTSAGTLTPEMSTFVWVAITYDCGTRRRGTPLTAYGPLMSSRPLSSCFRNTKRCPLKRPARRISTVPSVMLARSLVCLLLL